MILRPYQDKAIVDVRAQFAAGLKSVCLTAPCGAGKTVIFSRISQLANARGTEVGILVHRDSLLTQASDKLKDCGVKHGLIAPGHNYYGDTVHVASVQTLVRRLSKHKFDLLIVDEAHHATSTTYKKIFDSYPDAKILGVTATPCRTDGRGLDSIFQKLVLGPNIAELIRDGYLVEPETYGPKHRVDLSGVATKMGDYDQKQLAELIDQPRITGDAIEEYSTICPGKAAIAFCINIKHCEDVAAAFCAAGYKAVAVSGKMPLSVIRSRIAGLSDGSVQVLCACDLISEGTDVPAVVAAINLRATKSLGLHIQQDGRALRPMYAPGYDLSTRQGRMAAIAASRKPKAIILDHVANYARHMTVDEPHEWTLEGRKKRAQKEMTMSLTQCPKCLRPHRPAPRCPYCGHVYTAADPRTVEVVDGKLEKVDKEALRRARWVEEKHCKTFEDFVALGKKRGYHSGWARIRWDLRHPPEDMFR